MALAKQGETLNFAVPGELWYKLVGHGTVPRGIISPIDVRLVSVLRGFDKHSLALCWLHCLTP